MKIFALTNNDQNDTLFKNTTTHLTQCVIFRHYYISRLKKHIHYLYNHKNSFHNKSTKQYCTFFDTITENNIIHNLLSSILILKNYNHLFEIWKNINQFHYIYDEIILHEFITIITLLTLVAYNYINITTQEIIKLKQASNETLLTILDNCHQIPYILPINTIEQSQVSTIEILQKITERWHILKNIHLILRYTHSIIQKNNLIISTTTQLHPSQFTHPAIKNAVTNINQTQKIKSIKNLINAFESYQFINDQNFTDELLYILIHFYIATTNCTNNNFQLPNESISQITHETYMHIINQISDQYITSISKDDKNYQKRITLIIQKLYKKIITLPFFIKKNIYEKI